MNADPFIRNAAVTALAQPIFRTAVIQDLEHNDAKVRLGALLALRRANVAEPAIYIEPRLTDSDSDVVQMAMIWAGEKKLKSLAGAIDQVASKAGFSRSFFQAWLATMNIMEDLTSASAKTTDSPFRLQRQLSPEFIQQLASDESRPVTLRAIAIRWLQNLDAPPTHALLRKLARTPEAKLRIEAIRRLAESTLPDSTTLLLEIAKDRTQSPALRAEAITSLAGKPDASLVGLLDDPDPSVQLEAARSLRKLMGTSAVRDAVAKRLQGMADNANASRMRSQLEFLLTPQKVSRPNAVAEWQELLREGGDPEAGRRVFFSANSQCLTCHSLDGRGIKLGSGSASGFIAMPFGPDLSVIARTADRDSIIHSIVKPSDNIAPEYQGWFVVMQNGTMTTGREIDQERNAIQLITLDGREHDFPRKDVQTWGAMANSLMPEDLPDSMAIEEFRDLITFLTTLK